MVRGWQRNDAVETMTSVGGRGVSYVDPVSSAERVDVEYVEAFGKPCESETDPSCEHYRRRTVSDSDKS